MHTTNLRKVGGSVMLAVPPMLLKLLDLQPGGKVGMSVKGGRLVVERQGRPRYSLNELLLQCNSKAAPSRAGRAWVTDHATGRELL